MCNNVCLFYFVQLNSIATHSTADHQWSHTYSRPLVVILIWRWQSSTGSALIWRWQSSTSSADSSTLRDSQASSLGDMIIADSYKVLLDAQNRSQEVSSDMINPVAWNWCLLQPHGFMLGFCFCLMMPASLKMHCLMFIAAFLLDQVFMSFISWQECRNLHLAMSAS